jgi:hypothetical protein
LDGGIRYDDVIPVVEAMMRDAREHETAVPENVVIE